MSGKDLFAVIPKAVSQTAVQAKFLLSLGSAPEPRTEHFAFDLGNTAILASPDKAMAVVITPWTRTGFHSDRARFDRSPSTLQGNRVASASESQSPEPQESRRRQPRSAVYRSNLETVARVQDIFWASLAARQDDLSWRESLSPIEGQALPIRTRFEGLPSSCRLNSCDPCYAGQGNRVKPSCGN